jgi:Arm DNA-binding domain
MRAKLTKTAIDNLTVGWIWDQGLSGFGARRQKDGIFYYVRYRFQGKQRMHSIGRHGHLTPEQARRKAQELLGQVAGGQAHTRRQSLPATFSVRSSAIWLEGSGT